MNILIYALYQDGFGMGHIHRSSHLYQYFSKFQKNIVFATNLNNINFYNQHFDLIVFDCAKYDEKTIRKLKKLTKKLILLDYFCNSKLIDISINLFKREKINNLNYKSYNGLKYSIIKDEIKKNKKIHNYNNRSIEVLVTIGAEDKEKKVLKIYKYIRRLNLNIKLTIITKHLRAVSKSNLIIIPFTENLGYYMAKSDIVICNSGTTILEALYLGIPIIAISQNNNEKKFKQLIAKKVPLFQLSDIRNLNLKSYKFKQQIKYKYNTLIDGNGVSRIYKICVKK
jgi:spore coat polysaccharide biosynthesis predicted glycosyltransferase SpsG